MASSDPHPQGGSLSEMAPGGTTIPSDSAKPNMIPSVPRPGQATDSSEDALGGGAVDLAGAADNASDIPRSTKDPSAPLSTDIMTGTGDAMPPEVGEKWLHNVQQGDVSKGHQRYDKHVRQKGSELDDQGEQKVEDGVVE